MGLNFVTEGGSKILVSKLDVDRTCLHVGDVGVSLTADEAVGLAFVLLGNVYGELKGRNILEVLKLDSWLRKEVRYGSKVLVRCPIGREREVKFG